MYPDLTQANAAMDRVLQEESPDPRLLEARREGLRLCREYATRPRDVTLEIHFPQEIAAFAIWQGDCTALLRGLPETSVDAIVCDPPYGLEFMGKEWDKLGGDRRQRGDATFKHGDARHGLVRHGGTASYGVDPAQAGRAMQESHAAWAVEAFRVLKPGGHLLAFGGSRTFHRLACAIEDAGFEVRDSIVWMYGQGFPKSLNLAGDHAGWGTALKPGMEPIVVARKPLSERTVAANVAKHGTGALNIDGCRLATTNSLNGGAYSPGKKNPILGDQRSSSAAGMWGEDGRLQPEDFKQPAGRWPANVVLSHVPDDIDADGNEVPGCRCVGTREVKRELRDATAAVNESDGWGNMQGSRSLGSTSEDVPVWECAPGCPVAALDAQAGPRASGVMGQRAVAGFGKGHGVFGAAGEVDPTYYADEGGASRFFYQSKATNRERWGYCHDCDVVFNRGDKIARATHKPHKIEYHPTVKPVDLMRWLVRLVTPPGGLVVDPFVGTGTTGEAACLEGFRFIGMEREPTYARIAAHRLNHLEIS